MEMKDLKREVNVSRIWQTSCTVMSRVSYHCCQHSKSLTKHSALTTPTIYERRAFIDPTHGPAPAARGGVLPVVLVWVAMLQPRSESQFQRHHAFAELHHTFLCRD